jgi:hypothetical protein
LRQARCTAARFLNRIHLLRQGHPSTAAVQADHMTERCAQPVLRYTAAAVVQQATPATAQTACNQRAAAAQHAPAHNQALAVMAES